MKQKVLLAVPSARLVHAEFFVALTRWIDRVNRDRIELRFLVDAAANNIFQSRSIFVEEAKRWKADRLLMMDTDVIHELSPDAVFGILNQDFGIGWGAVISPTLSADFIIMAGLVPPVKPGEIVPDDRPREASWGACGFIALDGKTIRALKPIGFFSTISLQRIPAYCDHGLKTDDSVSFCKTIRDSGSSICIDPRIQTLHLKMAPIPSYREQAGIYTWDPGDLSELPSYVRYDGSDATAVDAVIPGADDTVDPQGIFTPGERSEPDGDGDKGV